MDYLVKKLKQKVEFKYNPFRKPTERELEHLQNIVRSIYNDFVVKVAQSRKIEINTIKNEIGALIYSSNQAEENFLIDGILDFDELIKNIINDKKFNNYKIIKIKDKNTFTKKYFFSFLKFDNKILCKKLNANFNSILPLFLKEC